MDDKANKKLAEFEKFRVDNDPDNVGVPPLFKRHVDGTFHQTTEDKNEELAPWE